MRINVRCLVATAALGGALVLVFATPASAHASLLESNPAPGEVLQASPDSVKLSFTEPVSSSLGAIRVYDSESKRVDTGEVKNRTNVVEVALPELEDGSYAVTWRVSSEDAHPITGAFTFQIGNAGNASSPANQALAERLLGAESGEKVVGAVYGITRGLLFAGLALMIGCAAFGLIVTNRARTSTINRRLVWIGWLMTTVGAVVGFLVYGPYAAGLGIGESFSSTVIEETLSTRYGHIGVARLVLLVLAIPIIRVLLARDGDKPRPVSGPWLGAAAVFGVLISATPGLSGHASSGDLVPLAVGADTIHVLAMGVWLGGLVTLGVVVMRGLSVAEMEAPVARWSRLAFGCMVAIVATGVFQAWRQVGNLTALRTTEYGRMLIIKILLFAGLLMLAAFSRESVRYLFPGPAPDAKKGKRVPIVAGGADDEPAPTPAEVAEYEAWEHKRLRRSVWAEVGVAVLVLSITALLVNAPPAKTAAATESGNAIGITLKSKDVWVDVVVVPGRSGRNAVHVSALTPKGAIKDVDELTITFSLPERDIAGIEVPLEKISAGHYTAAGFVIPLEGDWIVTVEAVVSEFTERTMRAEIEINES